MGLGGIRGSTGLGLMSGWVRKSGSTKLRRGLEVHCVRPGLNRKQMNIGIKEIKTQLTRESGSQVLTNQHAVRNQGQLIVQESRRDSDQLKSKAALIVVKKTAF